MSGRNPVAPPALPSGVVAGDDVDDGMANSAPIAVSVTRCNEGRFCCCSSEDIFGSSRGCKLHVQYVCLVHDSPRSCCIIHLLILLHMPIYFAIYICIIQFDDVLTPARPRRDWSVALPCCSAADSTPNIYNVYRHIPQEGVGERWGGDTVLGTRHKSKCVPSGGPKRSITSIDAPRAGRRAKVSIWLVFGTLELISELSSWKLFQLSQSNSLIKHFFESFQISRDTTAIITNYINFSYENKHIT